MEHCPNCGKTGIKYDGSGCGFDQVDFFMNCPKCGHYWEVDQGTELYSHLLSAFNGETKRKFSWALT